MTTTSAPDAGPSQLFWVGVVLSLVGQILIAVSLGVQKLAHNRNQGEDGEPRLPFVKLPLWWCGILMNMIGEVGNLLAYGMAPAVIVAPLGSVGVLINQVLAVVFLKEPFRRRDVVGILGISCGVVTIILAVPDTDITVNVGLLLSEKFYLATRCYIYLACVIVLIVFLLVCLEPTKGKQWILVWLSLCAGISSLTVIACRGFSGLITQIPTDCQASHCMKVFGHWQLYAPCMLTVGHWLFWVLLVVIVITAVWSTAYLGKAMIYYGSTEVVPVYYCTFTFASILGTGVVYNELGQLATHQAVAFACGLGLSLLGVGVLMTGRQKADSDLHGDAESVVGGMPSWTGVGVSVGVASSWKSSGVGVGVPSWKSAGSAGELGSGLRTLRSGLAGSAGELRSGVADSVQMS